MRGGSNWHVAASPLRPVSAGAERLALYQLRGSDGLLRCVAYDAAPRAGAILAARPTDDVLAHVLDPKLIIEHGPHGITTDLDRGLGRVA